MQETIGFWGKLRMDEEGTVVDSLPLPEHMEDVAACFEKLLDCGHAEALAISAGLPSLTRGQRKRLAVMAFLHDLGKLNLGFQAKRFKDSKSKHRGHVTEAVSLLIGGMRQKVIASLRLIDMAKWFQSPGEDAGSALCRMLICAWSHHGRPANADLDSIAFGARPDLASVEWPSGIEEICAALRDRIERTWPDAFGDDPPIPLTAAFMESFNGMLSMADWIGSDERHFVFTHGEGWKSRRDFAVATAECVVREIGLDEDFSYEDVPPLESVFGFQLSGIQSALAESARTMQ